MKNPNSAGGAGAFPVTSSATLTSTDDATSGPFSATKNERRFHWCKLSNSVQPLKTRNGRIDHG
jgi:hypothetical protein